MTREEWQRVKRVAAAALDLPQASRPAYVEQTCGGDGGLRAEVTALLRSVDKASTLFETAPFADLSGGQLSILFSADADRSLRAIDDFAGTARFDIVRRLGAGGMGVVYEAHDRVRREPIALKTLLRRTPSEIYRLKREFRSLADIAHPNLVCLYELFVEGEHCFFTMELIRGTSLFEFVRAGAAPAGSGADRAVDWTGVRAVFRQILSGLGELHAHGTLHRDLKPSNILVTPCGRSVILDFGLASDVAPAGGGGEAILAGTPAYLAPEQHQGLRPSPASDAYSVGVTLYHTVTGRLPDAPGVPAVAPALRARRRVSEGRAGEDRARIEVPADLEALCVDLLHPDPRRRLTVHGALERLAAEVVVDAASEPVAVSAATPFVGRAAEQRVLAEALAAAKTGRPQAVCIYGASGIGKSALVRHFLQGLAHAADVVVLRGRCYEREFVPYKALDGVIDSLSGYLRSLPAAEQAALVPDDVGPLVRAFPVMLQVEAVAEAQRTAAEHPDAAQRRLAFAALRRLLARIAGRQTPILCIDDLHWADEDSARLLEDLLQPPEPPPVLMLMCFRREELDQKPFLRALVDRTAAAGFTSLPLSEMTAAEAAELVERLIPPETASSQAARQAVADDAGGNPFLLEQLARHVAVHGAVTFGDVLETRLRNLPPGARRYLEVLALCGRPMTPGLVHEAAGLSGDERPLLGMLRADHLVRDSGSAARVETYHDRIRETLAARLTPEETRLIHGRVARTLTASGADDPEALFIHLRGSGDSEGASRHAAVAARKAQAALAFDRAAFFYRHALGLAPSSPAAGSWKRGLAEALTSAGRPADAADVYLDAAETGGADVRVDLQRRAAEQLLIGGHIDRGLTVIAAVLEAVGLRMPRGPRRTLAALIWNRAVLRGRGLRFAPRQADDIPPSDLLRIDTCWSFATGLALVDSVRGALFQTRGLRLALDAGEPYRVARSLAAEAAFLATGGGRTERSAAALARRARTIAGDTGNPHAIALTILTTGVAAFMTGRWQEASRLSGRALEMFREQGAIGIWETVLAQNVAIGSMLYEGRIREVAARVQHLLSTARENGNAYWDTELRTRQTLVWLAQDDPDEAVRQADDGIARWSHEGFHRQHYNHVVAHVQADLYRGRADPALQLLARHWPAMKRSLLFRTQWTRIEARYWRARCALLRAAARGADRGLLAMARRDARRIGAERMPWSNPLVSLIAAAIAYLDRDLTAARRLLSDAVAGFDAAGMRLHAAVARRRLGEVEGRDGSCREADVWMASEDIRNPAKMTRLVAPGFPDSD